jgi:hypothetical protein
MLTILIFAVLGLHISYRFFWEKMTYTNSGNIVFLDVLGAVLGTLVILLIFSLVGLGVARIIPLKTEIKRETLELFDIPITKVVSGDNHIYLLNYKENDVVKSRVIDYTRMYIQLSDDEKVERYQLVPTKSIINYFAIDPIIKEENTIYFIYLHPKNYDK